MKNISPALQNFLLDNTTFGRADLISITLPNSEVINVVSGTNTDIVFPGSQTQTNASAITQSGSGPTWNNTSNICGSVSYASTSLTAVTNASSQVLKLENFGFSIPTTIGSVIGVGVTANCYCSISGAIIQPNVTAQLIVGGSTTGTIQSFQMAGLPEFYFPTEPITLQVSNLLYPAGGVASTLTAAQVNGTTFGIALQANVAGTSGDVSTIFVNSITVTVTWQGGTGTTTYYTSQYGAWERGAFKNEASFRISSQSMDLKAFIPETVNYPGTSTPLMQTINQGMFNGAVVKVQTIFWPPGQVYTTGLNMGAMQLNVGQIGNVKQTGRSKINCEVYDLLYILNRPTPPFQIQSACRHSLFDAGCTLTAGSFLASESLQAGSTTLSLVVNYTPTYPTTLGYVIFTSGQNSGLQASIKLATTVSGVTTLQLIKPLPFPVSVSDNIDIYPGCDKTISTCQGVYNNLIHYGGTPFVPNPETAA